MNEQLTVFSDREVSDYYTPEELAQVLNVSVKFIYTHNRRIPGITKIGRLTRYRKSDVQLALLKGKLFTNEK